jgi:hypothetical protein
VTLDPLLPLVSLPFEATGRTDERVLLMDGGDVRLVLDCQIAFDVLLAEKQIDIVLNKRPFISGFEILAKKKS